MDLRSRLDTDMKDALRNRETVRLATVRGIRGAIKNREIELGDVLDDEGIVRVIRSLAKQRTEAIEQYRQAGREELVAKETEEKAVLDAYLPAAPDAEAVAEAVRAVIAEVGAGGPKDMGRVMKPVLERLGAGADGKAVSAAVKEQLAALGVS